VAPIAAIVLGLAVRNLHKFDMPARAGRSSRRAGCRAYRQMFASVRKHSAEVTHGD
jgi:hypothetical protein